MVRNKFLFLVKATCRIGPYLGRTTIQRLTAYGHGWPYKLVPDEKSIVVIGGSFAGTELVRRLIETLPTGYRVIWIEKNSHLNYIFNFPRYAVVPDHEEKGFIPYDYIAQAAPAGILYRIQDEAVSVTENYVQLASGRKVDYACLAIATGSTRPLPVNVESTTRNRDCQELRWVQRRIQDSQRIAVVGGGPLGVQLAGDIKSFHPSKEVTLIHSRPQLLSRFGKRLQDCALGMLRAELGVRVVLNERPSMPSNRSFARSASLAFKDGHKEKFDLIIGCTGQHQPNSSILKHHFPFTISQENSRILVRPNLQIFDARQPARFLPIFAFGDVADHPGPRMARAGWVQAEIVLKNILATIQGIQPSYEYTPHDFVEGAIKLTFGKTHQVIYGVEGNLFTPISDILILNREPNLHLEAEDAWKAYGADFRFA